MAARIAAAGAGAPDLRELADEAVALAARIGEALPEALREDDGGDDALRPESTG